MGKKRSKITKLKISKAVLNGGYGFQKGYTPHNKGKKRTLESRKKQSVAQTRSGHGKWNLGKKQSDSTKEKRSRSLKEFYKVNKHWSKGTHLTPEQRLVQSKAHKGEKSYRWQGGITKVNDAIRKSVEYKLWRDAVFKRDKHTCRFCGQVGGTLHADHIKPFAYFPELRFAIDNGRVLCKDCHQKTETFGNRKHH